MTFLQPWVLAALPLVTLPIIIHLINQRRFQTVQWAAMMFLLSAKALSRGYSRLRHWLIMALRMAAVAAVILAVGRPLSRGWLALAGGGRPDTAVVLLDRSPSMQARDPAAAESKLETGREQLARSLETLAAGRCILFTDPDRGPVELDVPQAVVDLPAAAGSAEAADIPGLLQAAYDYIQENAAGTTEVWICSDQRANDWADDSGSWSSLREAFARLPQQVRFQLVSYTQPVPGDLAVRVTGTRLERRGEDRQLVLSVEVSRPDGGAAAVLPLAFEVGGVSAAVDLELTGRQAVLEEHVIPLVGAAGSRGWGKVSLPADANAANNDFYFVFDEPTSRRAVIVAEDPACRRVLELVAGIPPEKDQTAAVDLLEPAGLTGDALAEAAVLLWQGDLPEGGAAEIVTRFVDRGGQVIFLPPAMPGSESFAGVSWSEWRQHPQPLKPQSWRADQDLLARTLSGAALPVGEIQVRRSCGITGEHVPLASLAAAGVEEPLLARVPSQQGGIYLLTTDPAADSSLASDGVVLYCLVQRAIDRGAAVLGKARQVDAGGELPPLAETAAWKRLAGPDAAATAPGSQAGVFESGDRLVAVNRPAAEDTAAMLGDGRIDELFRGLSVARISGRAGSTDSLVQEIWRAFLIAMVLALLGEGLLCLPRPDAARPLVPRPLEAAA
jgi:hypothetical protein